MSVKLNLLLDILDLRPDGPDRFVGGSHPTWWGRVFGGQVIAQSLRACERTVGQGRLPHSLHAYFLLEGDTSLPIVFEVERIRDGRSFATRRCVASQNGRAIFTLAASFQVPEDGFDHAEPMPDVPQPDDLPSITDLLASHGDKFPQGVRDYFRQDRAIEIRPTSIDRHMGRIPSRPRQSFWMRADGRMSDDPADHRAVLAYISDLTLLDAALIAHGRSVFDPAMMVASLDHALWLHRSFRADEWLLFAQDSPSASGGRGLARGLIFSQDGRLVASVMQEGLIRMRKPKA